MQRGGADGGVHGFSRAKTDQHFAFDILIGRDGGMNVKTKEERKASENDF